ncbi:hypothetical protein HHI36_008218 [Cryptolaemus montrouzieri]|uniref:Uncharacterized protein n=1 Tax=Cryptolaemus montrouzieri TaxID=559131 RepID=A0ABD2MS32_9CUCU
MRSLLLILATAAIVCASQIGNKNVHVHKDSTVIIHCENGKQMIVSKQVGPYGQQVVQIELAGPNTVTKMIQIDDNNNVRVSSDMESRLIGGNYKIASRVGYNEPRSHLLESSQANLLAEIIGDHQGQLDDSSYEELLHKVQKLVQKGKINGLILHHLQSFQQEQPWGNSLENSGDNIDSVGNIVEPQKWNLNSWNNLGHSESGKWWKQQQQQPLSYLNQQKWKGKDWSNCQGIWNQGMGGNIPCWCQGSHCNQDLVFNNQGVPMMQNPYMMDISQNDPWMQGSMSSTSNQQLPLNSIRNSILSSGLTPNDNIWSNWGNRNTWTKWNPHSRINWQQAPLQQYWNNPLVQN